MTAPEAHVDQLLEAQRIALANLEKLSSIIVAKRIKVLLLLGSPGSGKTTTLRAFCERTHGAQLLLALDLVPERPPSEDPDYVRDWCRKLFDASARGIVVVDGMDIFSSILSPDWMLGLVERAQQIPMRNFVILALSVGESRLLPSLGRIRQIVSEDRIAELAFNIQDAMSLANRFGGTVTGGDLYHARFRRDS